MSIPVSEDSDGAPTSRARLGSVRLELPSWLLLTWLLPTLSWLLDLALRNGTLWAWPAERWGVYLLTVTWGYLGWAVAALIGVRLTRKRAALGRAWFTLVSALFGACLALTWGYYAEARQYPTWSEVVFLIEESGNLQATVGLFRGKLIVASIVMGVTLLGCLKFWQLVVRQAQGSATTPRRAIAGWATLCFGLWLWRAVTPGMADAAPLFETGPVVAGMTARYYGARNRGVFHETARTTVPALTPRVSPPNVILVIHESLSRKALSLYGNPAQTTPRLDRRVAEDPASWFVFSRAVSNSSNTSVSVPTILLGLEPGSSLDDFHAAPALWHYARAAGYHTALLSAQSWHYAALDRFLLTDPPDQVWTAEPEKGITLANGGGMHDAEFFTHVEERLQQDARLGKPFLEVIQFNATHHPFLERPESGFDTSTRIGRYNGAVQLLDELMDRLLQSLEKNGVGDNTVILITADHGENHGEHPIHRTHSFYDEVVGIPFLIHAPQAVQGCRAADFAELRAQLSARAQNLDVVPTLLDVMGVLDAPALDAIRHNLDGQSLLKSVDPERVNVHRNVVPIRIWSNEGFAFTHGDERYSFTEWRGDEWYDLASDPEQLHDLSKGMSRLAPWAKRALTERPELAALRADYCVHLNRCIAE